MPENYGLRALKDPGLLSANYHKNHVLLSRALNVFRHGAQAASLRTLYATLPFLGKKRYDIIHCQFGTVGLQGLWLRDVGALTREDGHVVSRL